jgi:hypothetical protein
MRRALGEGAQSELCTPGDLKRFQAKWTSMAAAPSKAKAKARNPIVAVDDICALRYFVEVREQGKPADVAGYR